MKARILLVEDNQINSDMLCRRLGRRGYVLITAADGLQAVERAQRDLPDLILMDMSLPEIDGWEATRRIKADPATADIPVIALTAHALMTDKQRSFDAGCDEFETKPINLDQLLEKITKLAKVGSPV